jgi:glyoxylase-like metal-dependent hydrolase (beta-lactamase superfamily II)
VPDSEDAPLRYPFAAPPPFGEPVEVAPGILWLRLPLPYALDHVNVYLLEDAQGWALWDTGIFDEPSVECWERVLATVLGPKPITRLVVSHFHPDHVGMAGWLGERYAPPLAMPQAEYLYSRLLQALPADSRDAEPPFYRALGLESEHIHLILNQGKRYLQRVTGLPASYQRMIAGEGLRLGDRDWQILTGGGHAPEQAMLLGDGVFLSADQVLARISPNVSVVEVEPEADPLGIYLDSLRAIAATVPEEVLVLPGHDLPFYGLHRRTARLIRHHEHRCNQVVAASRDEWKTCLELIPVMFHRALDPHMMSFALGEALAHLNYLRRSGRLTAETSDGIVRYRAV